MTAPRAIHPNTTYFVTRRCSEQRMFLRPCRQTNQLLEFCIAYAANLYKVEIHAVCVMSNHWHAVLTDTLGQLPKFMEWVHRFIAKALNHRMKRREYFWSSEHYSAQQLPTESEVLDKMIYVLSNPATAHLVERAEHWPGLLVGVGNIGGRRTAIQRPEYFRGNGPIAPTATLELKLPRVFEGREAALARALREGIHHREEQARKERSVKGLRVLGVRRILTTSVFAQPKVLQRRYARNLRFTARSQKVYRAVRDEMRAFVQSYRQAWKQFQTGHRDVVFPAGTYWMRIHAQVACAQ